MLDLPLAQAVGPREHGEHGLQVRPEAAAGDARGQDPAGHLSTVGASQAIEPILIDDRLDLGQFGDLMDQGGRIVTLEFLTAAATGRRLTVERLVDLLGRD